MKQHEKTFAPRLPKEARERLKQSATHKDKKAYRRRPKHKHSANNQNQEDSADERQSGEL